MRISRGLLLGTVGLAALGTTLGLAQGVIQTSDITPRQSPHENARSQFAPGLGAGLGEAATAPQKVERAVATVHLVPALTPRSAATWMLLQEPISMKFPNETPLEEVLKYIKAAAKGKDGKSIPIYVDPVGLQEAEKTLQSPVSIDLDDVSLSTTLKLLLRQLSLIYYVQPDGLLVITSEDNEKLLQEPQAKILDELNAIRLELATLRREMQTLRGR